ncbi:hypothetical protein P3719_18490 [Vibrio parahaemolyticus]|uniref:Uncharacterized protein n=3 Tax=Vibrio TaxID=662 RepID=A0AA47L9W8_VIBPH|nr:MULTISPECIES: hypothetical protein [Vibrio]MDW1807458.1 hypothetical protein [Vibrio sp. Vb2362]MDW2296384.1 hypothetical protein [Vibrio sp. 1404]ALR95584.1 hypothetical protein AT730_25365 [Vibrio alginolyticus]APX09824.1 hypothetical protein BWP24_26800 [Vibrio campbellii]ARR10194.1 hypothetical protein Vc3S01_p20079 [Vibrio campbellii]
MKIIVTEGAFKGCKGALLEVLEDGFSYVKLETSKGSEIKVVLRGNEFDQYTEFLTSVRFGSSESKAFVVSAINPKHAAYIAAQNIKECCKNENVHDFFVDLVADREFNISQGFQFSSKELEQDLFTGLIA